MKVQAPPISQSLHELSAACLTAVRLAGLTARIAAAVCHSVLDKSAIHHVSPPRPLGLYTPCGLAVLPPLALVAPPLILLKRERERERERGRERKREGEIEREGGREREGENMYMFILLMQP